MPVSSDGKLRTVAIFPKAMPACMQKFSIT
jgi:hypothetical protein